MTTNPTIISYRSPKDQCAQFLNIDNLLTSDDSKKIKEIYDNILHSVTAYDPKYVKSFVKIENKLYERIISIENKTKKKIEDKKRGWVAFFLSVLTLGFRPLILLIKQQTIQKQINELRKTHEKFFKAFNQMESRSKEKKLHPKLEAIQDLEKSQAIDINQELLRLKSIPRVHSSLLKLYPNNFWLSIKQQVAFARSLELQEKLKDTHYVINHGQNLELMLVNILGQKLKQEFEPEHYESFEPLRHDTALEHIKEDTHTVSWYQKKLNKFGVIDHSLRKELLSADCVLESTKAYESALDFFAGRTNIAKREDYKLTFNLLVKIVQYYMPDEEITNKLCNDLVSIMTRCPAGGNLYSICVPKEKFDESCYFSKAYGTPLKNQTELKAKIDKMQSGQDPSGYPQIRILTHKIRPEDGYHVIMNSTLTKDELLKIDDEVSLCIQAALTGYRVQKTPKKVFQ